MDVMDQIEESFNDFNKEEKEFICWNASLLHKSENLLNFIENEMLPNYKDISDWNT